MERRRFMAMLAGGVLAAPLAATAQPQAPQRRIGVLLVLLSPTGKEAQAFRKRLHDADYVEGRDVVIEWRRQAATTLGFRNWPQSSSSAKST